MEEVPWVFSVFTVFLLSFLLFLRQRKKAALLTGELSVREGPGLAPLAAMLPPPPTRGLSRRWRGRQEAQDRSLPPEEGLPLIPAPLPGAAGPVPVPVSPPQPKLEVLAQTGPNLPSCPDIGPLLLFRAKRGDPRAGAPLRCPLRRWGSPLLLLQL